MPVYDPPPKFLRAALDSVLAQLYPHWELCVADDASTDPAVRNILEEYARRDARIRVSYRPRNGHIVAASNTALALANGEFVALLDHDDLLSRDALFEVANAIRQNPEAAVIYSDEDKLDDRGRRVDPYFKPDFNYELLLGQNVISHLGSYRRTLLHDIGGFQSGMEGSQDHDLVLRCIERLTPAQVIHIPRILYHWRVHSRSTAAAVENKPYALDAGIRALNQHFQRTCPGASAERHPDSNYCYEIRFPLPNPAPDVSIIVQAGGTQQPIEKCVHALLNRTRYANYELCVLDDGSAEPALLRRLVALAPPGRVRVLRCEGQRGRGARTNAAAAQCAAEYRVLRGQDVEVPEPDWLSFMVAAAARPGVGPVGARLWRPDGTLQHGGMIGGLRGVAGCAHFGIPSGHHGYFSRAVLPQQWSAVTGACLLVRRAVFDQVGGMDVEHLTTEYEDVDLCWRLLQAGYRNLWIPRAELRYHDATGPVAKPSESQSAALASDVHYMTTRWSEMLTRDPFFNFNLPLGAADFGREYVAPRAYGRQGAVGAEVRGVDPFGTAE